MIYNSKNSPLKNKYLSVILLDMFPEYQPPYDWLVNGDNLEDTFLEEWNVDLNLMPTQTEINFKYDNLVNKYKIEKDQIEKEKIEKNKNREDIKRLSEFNDFDSMCKLLKILSKEFLRE